MRGSRDDIAFEVEMEFASRQVEALLPLPPERPADFGDLARLLRAGKQMEQWVGVPFLSVPDGVQPSVPVTHVVDSADGAVRVPTHSRVPTIKQALLFLTTCEYCGEATSHEHSTTCDSCSHIYDPIPFDDDLPDEHERMVL